MAPNWIVEPKNVGGLVAGLARKADGGASVLAWDPASRSWVPSTAVDLFELSTAAPASERLLAELGVPSSEPVAAE